jgi:hypothetical protein
MLLLITERELSVGPNLFLFSMLSLVLLLKMPWWMPLLALVLSLQGQRP